MEQNELTNGSMTPAPQPAYQPQPGYQPQCQSTYQPQPGYQAGYQPGYQPQPDYQPGYQQSGYQQPGYQPGGSPRTDVPEVEALRFALLNAIRPSLRAPISAVLCDASQLQIQNVNGQYTIRGMVHSQNGYGAMLATDFTATAFFNGQWVITGTTVGRQAAANYAKNFAVNYIAISIFVAIMGLLSYFLITLMVG